MKRSTNKKQRHTLRGWVKWVPVVAIPFSILFFHTWLNIQILRADYVLRELDGEARDWAERLSHTGVAETDYEDPEMLAEQARLMAFVQPIPGQREMVYYNPSIPLLRPEEEAFAVAQGEGSSQPVPLATESVSDLAEQNAQSDIALPVVPATTPAPEIVPVSAPPVDQAAIPDAAVPAPVPEAAAPVTSTALEAPAAVVKNVVLDLPDEPLAEDVVDLESAMDSLESL